METVLQREMKVPVRELHQVAYLLRVHGIQNTSMTFDSPTTATITFADESDYLICILTGLISQAKEESGAYYFVSPDFDFMIRLEKKLKSYSKFDDFVIRKLLKDT